MSVPAAPKRRRWPWVVGGLAVVVIGVAPPVLIASGAFAGASQAGPTPAATSTSTTPAVPSFTMRGAFDLFIANPDPSLKPGVRCQGVDGGTTLDSSTPIRVFNADGQLLASGWLGTGTFVSPSGTNTCKFDIAVDGVPDGLPEYSVEIGDMGEQVVSSATAHNWVFFSDRNF